MLEFEFNLNEASDEAAEEYTLDDDRRDDEDDEASIDTTYTGCEQDESRDSRMARILANYAENHGLIAKTDMFSFDWHACMDAEFEKAKADATVPVSTEVPATPQTSANGAVEAASASGGEASGAGPAAASVAAPNVSSTGGGTAGAGSTAALGSGGGNG